MRTIRNLFVSFFLFLAIIQTLIASPPFDVQFTDEQLFQLDEFPGEAPQQPTVLYSSPEYVPACLEGRNRYISEISREHRLEKENARLHRKIRGLEAQLFEQKRMEALFNAIMAFKFQCEAHKNSEDARETNSYFLELITFVNTCLNQHI